MAKLLTSVTGLEFEAKDLNEAAERIYILEASFNVRQGCTKKQDRIPLRKDEKNTPAGQKEIEKHKKLLEEYYRTHGYDIETGIPKRERLESLGLQYIADELEKNLPYPEWSGAPLWEPDKYPSGGNKA